MLTLGPSWSELWGKEAERSLPLTAVEMAWTGSKKGGGKFLLHMADGFHEKSMDKDESVTFWFYHVFLRNLHVHTQITHFYIIYWPKAKFYLNFYISLPLIDLEKL